MAPPKNIKELRSLIEKLQFIRRFISQHSQIYRPFYELLKGGIIFEWNKKCQLAFDELKRYLSSPPIFKPPTLGKPLILYVSVIDDSIRVVLAQLDEEGKERATYYLSKFFNEDEKKYTAIEKTCVGVV